MAAIAATAMTGSGKRTATFTALDGSSDTFTYVAGSVLIMKNDSGGALSPTIDGDGGTTKVVAGIGSVDVSGGYAVGSIADGAAVAIPLDTIKEFLKGTIAISSGTGLDCALLTF